MLNFFNKELEAWNRSINRESIEQERILKRSWDQLMVSAIDTETTGFHPEAGDEVLSIAAVKWKGTQVGTPFHSYIKIEGTVPPHITGLTGITESHLLCAPPVRNVLEAFLKFVDSTVIIGYYVGHDIKFINYFLWRRFRTRLKHRVIELKTIIDLLYPEWAEYTFDDVCGNMGVVNNGRHTSKGDAIAAVELWSMLVKELDQAEIHSLGGLYQQLAHRRKTM